MALADDWPTVADDDGSKTTGTIFNKALTDAMLAAVEGAVESTTNPSEVAADIIDEVVDARGSLSDLDTRLSVALNANGTLKTQASLVSVAQATELPQTNLILNDTFLIWAAGDAAAPTGWTLAGTGAAVARAGTGLGDTTRKVGDFCAKLTYGSAALTLGQTFIPAAAYARLDHLDGEVMGFGAWVWSSAASQVRLYFTDGASASYSDYHTGGSGWEWLSGTHTISSSATALTMGARVESGGANPAYFSGPTVQFSQIAPPNWRPAPTAYGTIVHKKAGTTAIDTQVDTFVFQRMGIVKDVQLYAETAPTGQELIVDVNGGDGTNSMFSTLPQLAAAANHGAAQPDGTYQYRCFAGYTGDTPTASMLTSEVTQVGSGAAGADLNILIRAMVYLDPLEAFKAA